MTFGLLILFKYQNDYHVSLQNQLNLIKLFDKVIDRIWVIEHHYNSLRANSAPLIILNPIAKCTNNIKFALGIKMIILNLLNKRKIYD